MRVSSWVVHNTIEYNSLIDLLHIAPHPVQFNLFCAVRNFVMPIPVLLNIQSGFCLLLCAILQCCVVEREWQMLVAVNSSAGDTLPVHSGEKSQCWVGGGTKGE